MLRIKRIKGLVLLAYGTLRRKLVFCPIPIFTTNRCNSRCRTCNIWKKKPKTDLDPRIIKGILGGKVVSRYSMLELTGGEFILHPEYREILSLLNHARINWYVLLSNSILANQLINTVREYGVKNISLSLDGPPGTYEETRGVDNYSNVEKVVKELSGDNVRISIDYTVSPLNSRDDLKHVMRFCARYGVALNVGYYTNVEYYDAQEPPDKLYNVQDLMSDPYHRLYPIWASGNLKMPCLSIFLRPVIRPNGDVELCESRETKLGNLYEQNLEEIWSSKRTRMLQRRYVSCNACWLDAQRGFDISIISTLMSFVPSSYLDRIFGNYDWKKIRHCLD